MAEIEQVPTFWQNPYVRELPPNGKLALAYILDCMDDGRQVLIEDMSLLTGLESSECSDWSEKFEADGIIDKMDEPEPDAGELAESEADLRASVDEDRLQQEQG